MRRTLWQSLSATYSRPSASHATSVGVWKRADVGAPPSPLHPVADAADPAKLVMTPVASAMRRTAAWYRSGTYRFSFAASGTAVVGLAKPALVAAPPLPVAALGALPGLDLTPATARTVPDAMSIARTTDAQKSPK